MSKPPIDVIHSPLGSVAASRREHREHVVDRSRGLEPRVVAGPQAEQHDVVVIVDEPGTTVRPSRSIVRVQRVAASRSCRRREPVADDPHGFDDAYRRVHRVDAAVRDQHVAHGGAGGRARLREGRYESRVRENDSNDREQGSGRHDGGPPFVLRYCTRSTLGSQPLETRRDLRLARKLRQHLFV